MDDTKTYNLPLSFTRFRLPFHQCKFSYEQMLRTSSEELPNVQGSDTTDDEQNYKSWGKK